MIFDVTGAFVLSGELFLWSDTLELGHDYLEWLTNNVEQDIKSASVWHTNNKGAPAFFDTRVNSNFQSWDETFTTF